MKTKTRKMLALIILTIMVLTIVPITKVLAETDVKPIFAISKNIIMKRDETSTLDVSVNEKLEFISFRTNLKYDANAIEITGIDEGENFPNNAKLKAITQEMGEKITGLEITSTNGEPIAINSARLFGINVKAKDNANLGKYTINLTQAELLSDDDEKINITPQPGSIIITEMDNSKDKPEFKMIYTEKMFPGEEQIISVLANDKLNFRLISSLLSYDDGIEVVDVKKGNGLPDDAEVVLYHDGISGQINGFDIQGKGVIQIDPNEELVNITIKTSENATPGNGKIGIDWNDILNQDWNEVIADDISANIQIMPELKGIEFIASRIEISRGTEFKMQYKLTPENISPLPKIEWITANKDVATVDSNGIVTAVGVGETTITAKVGEYTATAQIIVTEKPTIKPIIEIRRNKLVVGETEQINVKIEPEDAANLIEKIEYSSSDPTIATVDEKGIIKAINPGKVKINAIINEKFVSEVEITVTNPDVPNTGDSSITLFISIMLISFAGIVWLTIINKKK